MAHDREQIQQLAPAYTDAWCSRDPQQVAAPGGSIAINGGDPTRIVEVAEAFIAAFPDIEVVMDDLVLRDYGSIEYRWTFTGTSAETGMSVRVPGYEEWTIAPNGLIAESRGHYDQAEYERQLKHGVSAAPSATQASAASRRVTFPHAGPRHTVCYRRGLRD
jgi:SnoaL-like polyketide cyclase